MVKLLQLSLSPTVTLETEESRHCREVAVVDKFKLEWMYELFAKKKTVAVMERWPLVQGSTANFFTQEFNLVLPCKLITTEHWTVFCVMCLERQCSFIFDTR